MRFELEFNMDNAAFDGEGQVTEFSQVLRKLAAKVEKEGELEYYHRILDSNGNAIGEARVR